MNNKPAIVHGLSKLMAIGMLLALGNVALSPQAAHAQVIWEPLVIDHNNSKEADAAPSGI